MALTPEQLSLRKNGIGGSDAASICGLNQYKTPRQLWYEKTSGEVPEVNSIHVRIGQCYEPLICREYVKSTGLSVSTPDQTFFHKDYPFLFAHVDGVINETGSILEIKTCMSWGSAKKFGDEDTDELPDAYLLQAAHYSAVLQKDEVDFFVMFFSKDADLERLLDAGLDLRKKIENGTMTDDELSVALKALGKFKKFKYKRNLALEEKYLKKAQEFWGMVTNLQLPDASNFDEALDSWRDTEKTTNSEEALIIAQKLIENKAICKELEKQNDALKEKLVLSMGDAATLVNHGGEKVAKILSKKVNRLDMGLLKEAVPDLAPYYRQTIYQELRTF